MTTPPTTPRAVHGPSPGRARGTGRPLRRAGSYLCGLADLEQVEPVGVPVVNDVGQLPPLLLPGPRHGGNPSSRSKRKIETGARGESSESAAKTSRPVVALFFPGLFCGQSRGPSTNLLGLRFGFAMHLCALPRRLSGRAGC